MENFTHDIDADGIALFTFDCPGRSMNVLGASQMDDITAIVEMIKTDDAIKGAVWVDIEQAPCAERIMIYVSYATLVTSARCSLPDTPVDLLRKDANTQHSILYQPKM